MRRTLIAPATGADTLIHRLHRYAIEQPEQVAYTFLRYGEGGNESCTYQELDQRARVISGHLREQRASGKPVLLLFPSGLEYIAAYFGCLYAGAIAVPAYPPHSERDLPRIQAIVADAQAHLALTTAADLARVTRWTEKAPETNQLKWIATDSLSNYEAEPWQVHTVDGDTLAFLQYTSGSTTTPKGVMVSHNNLMHNLAMLESYWKMRETSNPVGVYWLPIFHDMGLILGLLSPMYSNYPTYFMSPIDFLQRPLRWLQAISNYRGSFSSAPNFAYELCLRRVSKDDLSTLDLSCWQAAGNAAEPVRSDTIERFTRYFAPSGFESRAFRPAYGLAESTLVVSCGDRGDPVCVRTINRHRLEEDYVEATDPSDENAQKIVGCGRPIHGHEIAIVNPETYQRCEPDRVGEIWVSGPTIAQGYWGRPQETAETFQAYLATGEGPFMRTGDLGVLEDENLFVTGRRKDLIIINGRNLYPQDIELTAEQVQPAIRAGNCVAFSLELDGEERLLILAEINQRQKSLEGSAGVPLDTQEIIKSVRRAVAERHKVHVHQVLLLKTGGILKTTSGKLQRRACRQAFVQGTLKLLA